MTLRTKLAAFHARIHSHRHNNHHHHHHHFHLPHLRHKSSKDSNKDKDKEKSDASSSSSPSRKASKTNRQKNTSPSRKPSTHTNRDSLSSTSTTSSSSGSTGSPSPSPILTLIIPTPSHQNHTIEARVYHPTDFPQNYGLTPSTPRKAAVVAHPYAALGGNWDDPVVLSLVALLTQRGYIVATFNFCGAGNSKGKTSWTGDREREEYATVSAFLVKYVECIDPHAFMLAATTTTSTTPSDMIPTTPTASLVKQPIKVLLAGYSYGSLIASRTPSASHILKTVDKDILAYATRTAYEWASTEKRRSFAMARGAALGRSVWANNDDDDDNDNNNNNGNEEGEERGETSRSVENGTKVDEKVNYNVQLQTETSWLLVSPLLPPVSMFLNLPNPMSWFPTKQKKEEEEEEQSTEDDAEDERDVFAVYGTDDMFTGIGKYRNWTKGKVERSAGKFKGVEIDEAGHFWMQEDDWMVKLRDTVAGWIDEKSGVVSV